MSTAQPGNQQGLVASISSRFRNMQTRDQVRKCLSKKSLFIFSFRKAREEILPIAHLNNLFHTRGADHVGMGIKSDLIYNGSMPFQYHKCTIDHSANPTWKTREALMKHIFHVSTRKKKMEFFLD